MEQSPIRIAPFLDGQGRVTLFPQKRAKRAAVLRYLAEKFETDRSYTEKEVNDICLAWHTFNDYFLVRRSLVEEGLLSRKPDGSCYWRTAPPKEPRP